MPQQITQEVISTGVTLYGGPIASKLLSIPEATSLSHEYNSMACTIEIVDDVYAAIDHIHEHGRYDGTSLFIYFSFQCLYVHIKFSSEDFPVAIMIVLLIPFALLLSLGSLAVVILSASSQKIMKLLKSSCIKLTGKVCLPTECLMV